MRLALTVVLSAWIAWVSGCGYHLARSGDSTRIGDTVALVTLGNDSSEPGLEILVSEALRKEFLHRGALELISNPDRADVVVRGSVGSFRVASQSVSSVAGALEYVLELGLNLTIERAGESSFEVPDMRANAIYPSSADLEVARKNRREAVRRLSQVLAVRLHDILELRLAP